MKIKDGFVLRSLCGEHVVISEGKENIDFSQIINLNESSAFLWKNVIGKEFTVDDLVTLLTGEYEVSEETAREDILVLVDKLFEAGLIEK